MMKNLLLIFESFNFCCIIANLLIIYWLIGVNYSIDWITVCLFCSRKQRLQSRFLIWIKDYFCIYSILTINKSCWILAFKSSFSRIHYWSNFYSLNEHLYSFSTWKNKIITTFNYSFHTVHWCISQRFKITIWNKFRVWFRLQDVRTYWRMMRYLFKEKIKISYCCLKCLTKNWIERLQHDRKMIENNTIYDSDSHTCNWIRLSCSLHS